MVTKPDKSQQTGEKEEKKGRVKIDKLQLNKETVMDLTDSEEKMVRGGVDATTPVKRPPSMSCARGCDMAMSLGDAGGCQ